MGNVEIGERIKVRRQELKLSQRALAERMGYTNHTAITKIEQGLVDLPQSRIKQFAEVLDLPVGSLMGWEAEPEELGALAAQVIKNPELLKLVQNYLAASEAERTTVQTLLETFKANKKS